MPIFIGNSICFHLKRTSHVHSCFSCMTSCHLDLTRFHFFMFTWKNTNSTLKLIHFNFLFRLFFFKSCLNIQLKLKIAQFTEQIYFVNICALFLPLAILNDAILLEIHLNNVGNGRQKRGDLSNLLMWSMIHHIARKTNVSTFYLYCKCAEQ